MNFVDGSDHYKKTSDEPPPSLLTIIIDTNPHAWALLAPTLPLSSAIANLLVFINAHLAFNNANKIAIIACHTQRAEFLYPPPPSNGSSSNGVANGTSSNDAQDVEMTDGNDEANTTDSNHYRPFQQVQRALLSSLQTLFASTSPSDLSPTTSIAGALTLALTYINKSIQSSTTLSTSTITSSTTYDASGPTTVSLSARILILSVSGDLAAQYIPIMNTIFACQRQGIPIDIAKIAGDTVFLQQASDATKGTYIKLERPQGLLQYLMMGFMSDGEARRHLVAPTAVGVDFRAACFCHRRVVDTGWVCSVCLSIFCSPPEGAMCLTCGTHLKLGNYGAKPVVVAKRKKKRKEKA